MIAHSVLGLDGLEGLCLPDVDVEAALLEVSHPKGAAATGRALVNSDGRSCDHGGASPERRCHDEHESAAADHRCESHLFHETLRIRIGAVILRKDDRVPLTATRRGR